MSLAEKRCPHKLRWYTSCSHNLSGSLKERIGISVLIVGLILESRVLIPKFAKLPTFFYSLVH